MLIPLRKAKSTQMVLGLLAGFVFGFLLQRGGATNYNVIIGQLLLKDFTVLKIMMSAVVVGMIGVFFMRDRGWVNLHPKPGSVGMTVVGGLIFGAGFALLGYCPGTAVGAVGQGQLDALFGGVPGIVLGAGLFAVIYPHVQHGILTKGHFGTISLPDVFKVNHWIVIPVLSALIVALFVSSGELPPVNRPGPPGGSRHPRREPARLRDPADRAHAGDSCRHHRAVSVGPLAGRRRCHAVPLGLDLVGLADRA